jgi:oligopeptide/dipeptide ABC transporter ATP-binding protein
VQELGKSFALPRRRLFGPALRVTAVDGVSFAIPAGSTLGLVGESGSGKTTVARILLKVERPSAGQVLFDGEEVFAQGPDAERAYRREVQAVLQDPYGALSPRMRVEAIVSEPLRAQAVSREKARAVALDALERVGLSPSHAARYPHQFSGGQRQRIAVARAISVEPRLIVLDEPVAALDVSIRAQILTLLRELQSRTGLTYLFIGHDLATVRLMSDRVAVMYFGRLVEIGPASDVLVRPLHPYTRKLVDVARGDQPLGAVRIGGELPSPLDPPSGCHFRTRCPLAVPRCADERPVLRELTSGHAAACHRAEDVASCA